jgi:hypothetical protein
VPDVHYIPLSEDLRDLNETLHWVQDHPVEVKAIADQGRLFWEKYLTFQNHEEHIFELVYRLSEYTHYLSTNITTHLIPAIEPVKLPETEELVSDVVSSAAPVPRNSDGTLELNASLAGTPSAVLEATELPTWTTLPRSQFTENVLGIIHDIKIAEISSCFEYYSLFVTTPNTVPSVQCPPDYPREDIWCDILRVIFDDKTLAYNVSLGFILNDLFDPSSMWGGCIGNSSPGGRMVMPNMEDVLQMHKAVANRRTNPEQYRWPYRVDVPLGRATSHTCFSWNTVVTGWVQGGQLLGSRF